MQVWMHHIRAVRLSRLDQAERNTSNDQRSALWLTRKWTPFGHLGRGQSDKIKAFEAHIHQNG